GAHGGFPRASRAPLSARMAADAADLPAGCTGREVRRLRVRARRSLCDALQDQRQRLAVQLQRAADRRPVAVELAVEHAPGARHLEVEVGLAAGEGAQRQVGRVRVEAVDGAGEAAVLLLPEVEREAVVALLRRERPLPVAGEAVALGIGRVGGGGLNGVADGGSAVAGPTLPFVFEVARRLRRHLAAE